MYFHHSPRQDPLLDLRKRLWDEDILDPKDNVQHCLGPEKAEERVTKLSVSMWLPLAVKRLKTLAVSRKKKLTVTKISGENNGKKLTASRKSHRPLRPSEL